MSYVLLILSLLCYGSYGILGLAYLVTAIALSYGTARLNSKCRWTFWGFVAVNAAMLVGIKLQPVTGISFFAPLGISYFTLQLLSYNVDVYRGKYEAEKDFCRYALCVSYFPKMFLGPIERYDDIAPALYENRQKICWEGIFEGGLRILWGLCKKLVIAARVGVIIGAIAQKPEEYTGAFALAAMLLYSLQLYADFSGGIDMVLGVSRMLGIRLSENFNAPYLSQSVQEFWQRWHMTLGTWLRNCIYIPLGGNRKGKVRKTINLILTFLVSGLWHGVQYLLWGLFNGIFVAFGAKLKTKWKHLNRIGTFLLISLLWAFFVWPDMQVGSRMLLSLFTTFNYGSFFATVLKLGLTVGDWIVLGAFSLALWFYDVYKLPVGSWISRRSPAVKTALLGTLALLVLIFGMYGLGFDAGSFIYSQF